jgi:hypothetical protein
MTNHMTPETPRVWVATVHHKHGSNVYTAATEQMLMRELAEYCRESWKDAVGCDETVPSEPPEGDQAAIDLYFQALEGLEFAECDQAEVAGAAVIVAAVPAPTRERAGQRRVLVLELLSQEHFTGEEDVASLVRRAIDDDLAMTVLAEHTADVDGPTLAQLTLAQASKPSFFGLDGERNGGEAR